MWILGSEDHHIEIRYRTLCEMVLRKQELLDYTRDNSDSINWFEHLSPGPDVYTNDNDLRVLNEEILRCARLNEWSSVWQIFGCAQALKIDIKQIHPLIKLNNTPM